MGAHIISGQFQSDKYPTCPPGKVPLSVKDTTAQDLLWEYAQRRRAVDTEFSDDLETALRSAGYVPAAADSAPRENFAFLHRRFDETWVEPTKAKATIAALQTQFGAAPGATSTTDADLAEVARLARELPAVKEQLRGAMNRLRLAEEAMRRAFADRDRLRQTVGAFIGAVKSEMGGTVSVCRFYPRDGAPHLCAFCCNPKQSHPDGGAR